MKQWLFLISFLLALAPLRSQVLFEPIDTLAFLQDTGYLRGISWVDVDNDGDLDVSVSGITGSFPNFVNVNSIFLNQGNLHFQNTGLIQSAQANPMGHGWADIENDGDLDVYFGATWNAGGINELWLNEGGSFTQVTNTGATPPVPLPFEGNVSWGDYDNDGYVDLFLSRWNNSANKLYRNQGDGTFVEITGVAPVATAAWTSAGIWGDYDNDRDLDLYVVNYQIGSTNPGTNELYQNNGDGTFTQQTIAGDAVNYPANSRAANWVDYNNDGWLDLFVVNQNAPDRLYQNNGNGTFTGSDLGANSTSWSSNWGDYDNDGDQDVFVMGFFGTDSRLWRNEGQGQFTDVTGDYPAILPTQTNGSNSNSVIWVDADQNGWLDLHLAQPNFDPDRLYLNQGADCQTWLQIQCIGDVSNWAGIGTTVRLRATVNGQSTWQTQQVSAQTSKPGQNPQWLHFGLDDATLIDSLIVEWPAGTTCTFTDLLPSRFIRVEESACEIEAVLATPVVGGSTLEVETCGEVQLTPNGPAGGTWTADCSDCVDEDGLFTVSGLSTGTYQVLYEGMDPCGLVVDTFQVEVLDGSAGSDTQAIWCEDALPTDLLPLLAGTPTPGGEWVDADFMPIDMPYAPNDTLELLYYLVTAADCSDTAQLVLQTVPAPAVTAVSTLTEGPDGSQAELMAMGAVFYAWSPPTGLSCTDCEDPVITEAGTYVLTLVGTDDNGCQDSTSLTVTVPGPDEFELPNIFTPDGDGTNDTFGPVFRSNPFTEYQLMVFNRWGEMVYETRDPLAPWTGEHEGNPLPMDTYYYRLNYEFSDGIRQQQSGEINLIR